jgi:asparaginyl-tRNA synthetase
MENDGQIEVLPGFLKIIDENWYNVLVELQNLITVESVNFFNEKGYKYLHVPLTTNSISSPMGLGSDSLPVKIDMFGVKTFLADSMQFMLEYGCRFNERGTFYIMPSFRGENPDLTHLCQFYHSEAEISGTLDDVISLVEKYIKHLSNKIISDLSGQIISITKNINHLDTVANLDYFPRIKMEDLIKKFSGKDNFLVKHECGFYSLTREGERELIKEFGGIVWVTHFEHLSVPFYQAYDDENPHYSKSADLLFGLGEVVGTGERHIDHQNLQKALNHHEVPVEDYEWYYQLKKHKPMLTSGFGMGIERFICWVLRHHDIRNCQIIERVNGEIKIP